MKAKKYIIDRQIAWATKSAEAKKRGIEIVRCPRQDCCTPVDSNDAHENRTAYTTSLNDNLFEPLDKQSQEEFEHGDGHELRGNMRALYSSSALACNLFHYWKVRDPGRVAHYLDVPSADITSIHFEKKFPILPRGTPPNIDIAIHFASGAELDWIGIESKMTETYPAVRRKLFDEKYFTPDATDATDATWWVGLDETKRLAESFRGDGGKAEATKRHLDRGQLIKHLLGLRNACRLSGTDPSRVMLIYLWYDVRNMPGIDTQGQEEADAHCKEVEEFGNLVLRDGINFRALTCQEFVANLQQCNSDERDFCLYRDYLTDRYCPKTR